ncbi:MAG: V0D/AC39 family V-type ATPase subunit [Lachnospiraceae bacterium]|nr:V-type ATPase subunit [Candidatus Fimimorpha excrementavium]
MPSLLKYSGITTKVRAMQSKLIKPSGYEALVSLEHVSDALSWLKHQPAYAHVFDGLEESKAHRGEIESLLTNALYEDFTKIYRFADMKQRKFMDFYFMHYEIAILKKCLRSAYAKSESALDLSMFRDFFEKHSDVDIIRLGSCMSIDEFIHALHGSRYYGPLSRLKQTSDPSLFDYEMALDLYYFSYIWKTKDKVLKAKDRKVLTEVYGPRLDLLNVQWIYRAKKYYDMAPVYIYSLLIPCNYKIRPAVIKSLVECGSLDEFTAILSKTPYAAAYRKETDGDILSIETLYTTILKNIFSLANRRNPYSIACINSYLYFKEEEIQRITTIIEGIRYQLPPGEIAKYALNT